MERDFNIIADLKIIQIENKAKWVRRMIEINCIMKRRIDKTKMNIFAECDE